MIRKCDRRWMHCHWLWLSHTNPANEILSKDFSEKKWPFLLTESCQRFWVSKEHSFYQLSPVMPAIASCFYDPHSTQDCPRWQPQRGRARSANNGHQNHIQLVPFSNGASKYYFSQSDTLKVIVWLWPNLNSKWKCTAGIILLSIMWSLIPN